MSENELTYKRLLLKLSGEALMGSGDYGIDNAVIERVAGEIRDIVKRGVEVGLVIGGGNIFRGISLSASGMQRSNADYMGMLATVMNALAMQDTLERIGVPAKVMSAIPMAPVCEAFDRRKALAAMQAGEVVLFAAGTGNPYFTTDSAASLRAIEIGADIMLKATKVDGVYSDDPMKNPDAERYETLSYDEVVERKLGVMDTTAVVLCRDQQMPLGVFDINNEGALMKIVSGERIGTIVQ
ncbi:UMP kinase [Solemya pervernicosa gill symbiont]|uniref:Uridylate kinase n=2 Tax=Gammaproteobacteria incertae sedis TaxID=118884 RepID=A0A1T2L804_9GAMM|nr:UMP kinase [Candidatus Reidiella endopervernicosa]OOZ41182.1 UMP kinase [Solemya pervernicosa gill symbiont]QKQ27093.1 UMP kinase [Candidatus Reidiella endopervernicosa]